MRHRTLSYVSLSFTVFLWGLSFLSIKAVIGYIPPMTLGFLRFFIAVGILWALKRFFAPKERLAKKDIPLFALSGFVGVSLYFLMENNGILLITASEASIIVGIIPAVSAIADHLFLKTKLSKIQNIGIGASIAGIILLVAPNLSISNSVLGYCFMLGAVLSWVGYSFLTKPLFKEYSRIGITFYQTIFGLAGFVPFAMMERSYWTLPDIFGWFHVLYLGIFCSAIGYFLYVKSLDELGISTSSVFINLIPVVTVIAEVVLFGIQLSWIQIAGGITVVSGVYMATLGDRIRERPGKRFRYRT